MYKRPLVEQIKNRMKEKRLFMQIVIGPRQTGKTTAILQALEVCGKPHHYVSADDPVLVSPEWLRNEWEQARRTPPRSCPTQKSWASCLTRATR